MQNRTGALAGFALAFAGWAIASNCNVTSTGRVPINDLGPGLYLGQYKGGLYPFGNSVPPEHANQGFAHTLQIAPRNLAGASDPNGQIVLLSIGMSNTTQEFCGGAQSQNCQNFSLIGRASSDTTVDHAHLTIIDGAAGGQTANTWNDPADANYDRVRDTILIPRGLSEAQVQCAWVKVADANPSVSLPAANSDAFILEGYIGGIMRALKVRYPNIQVAFLSSRIYAGYASSSLNPEPYAYESGFSCKWAIEAQIKQMNGQGIDPIAGDLNAAGANPISPWIAWGPYLWADGLIPRSDGLIWQCSDFTSDGTHPADPGRAKVGLMLLNHFKISPFSAPWFRANHSHSGDVNGDGRVDGGDIALLLGHWGQSLPLYDLNSDGIIDGGDLGLLLSQRGS